MRATHFIARNGYYVPRPIGRCAGAFIGWTIIGWPALLLMPIWWRGSVDGWSGQWVVALATWPVLAIIAAGIVAWDRDKPRPGEIPRSAPVIYKLPD